LRQQPFGRKRTAQLRCGVVYASSALGRLNQKLGGILQMRPALVFLCRNA
jgi:hypothetical protein